jgi:uncharacterized protein (TIGR03437 family)
VNHAGLAPGTYTGDVTTSLSTNEIRSTNITLIVLPALAASASKERAAVGCLPARLSVTHTGLVNSFAAPAGFPTPLVARVSDDCGDPVAGAQVVAEFSNGDPVLPMRLADAGTGLFSATWTPSTTNNNVTVRVFARADNLISATAEIIGAVTPNRAPALTPNRVVNNLNGKNGDPLAPGTVAQVHGFDLAPSAVEPGVLPLRTTFNGTTVLVGLREAPLYFLSDRQLNVQLPTELEPNREHQIVVQANGGITTPDTISIAPATPGLLAFPDARIIAQHASYELITETSPAREGESIILYLVGMGATNPSVPSGNPSPAVPVVAPATVTVGGRPANIQYAGLTPGAVGLYQINLEVPTGATGDLLVEVRQDGILANTATLPVR